LVEELKAALRDQDSLEARFTSQLLRSAVATSNEVVWKKAQEGGGLTGMATTLCACLLHGSEGVVANVGDSRAYLITGSAKRITLDHSLREEWMMKRGTDPAIGNEPPPDNIITRALGVESTVQVDTFRVSIPPGGILLVCSDGVTKVVSDDELGALALGQTGAKAVCRSLVRKANERGGPDNITIIAATRSFR
jgi:protein phosphatase